MCISDKGCVSGYHALRSGQWEVGEGVATYGLGGPVGLPGGRGLRLGLEKNCSHCSVSTYSVLGPELNTVYE